MVKLKKMNLSSFKNLKIVEIGKEDVLQPQALLENKQKNKQTKDNYLRKIRGKILSDENL